jgi:hypothetical protein
LPASSRFGYGVNPVPRKEDAIIAFYGRIWAKDEEGNIFSRQTKTLLIGEDEQSLQQARMSVDAVLAREMPHPVKTAIRYFYNEWNDAIWRF